MFGAYSASKKTNYNRQQEINERFLTSKSNDMYYRSPYLTCSDDKTGLENSRRQMSCQKQLKYEENKQNQNYSQIRQRKYSPIKPDSYRYVSPIKQPYSQCQLAKNRRNKFTRKELYEQEIEESFALLNQGPANQTYTFRNTKYNKYNSIQAYPSTQIPNNKYQSYSSRQLLEKQQKTPRLSYRNNQNPVAHVPNRNNYNYIQKTPPKCDLNLEKLTEKSQFLRQKIERINRMTPKSFKVKAEKNYSVTPQKQVFVEPPKEKYESYENNIIKFNKYCNEKLPLQPIFDIEELREQHMTNQSQLEPYNSGLEQINKLSQKINDRLKEIISRHEN